MPDLKTDESLLDALKRASTHSQTADEVERQRVSFIMGSLKTSSGVTRAQVQEILAQHEGKRAS
jgi:hypothetical protein